MPSHSRHPAPALLAAALLACVLTGSVARSAPLGELTQDRVRAAAQYATGKTLFEQGDLAAALRCYQRAWRWDPDATTLLDEIVPLAMSLNRVDEAVRYALVGAERGRADPDMLRRLALYVTEQQQWGRAARLYRLWLASAPERGTGVSRALVQLEIGRLEYLSDRVEAASEAFAQTQAALLDDADTPTARRVRAALGGALGATWETFGRCHLEAGRLELAARAFAEMAASPDTERQGHYWNARVALAQGRPLDAYEHLWRYFDGAGDPLGALPYEALRDALVRLNERERLEEDVQRLRRSRPEQSHATLALAKCYASLGRVAEADALYESLVRRGASAPGDVEADALAEAGRWLIGRIASADQPNRLLPLVRLLARRSESLAPYKASLQKAMENESLAEQTVARLGVTRDAALDALDALALARLALVVDERALASEYFRRAVAHSGDNAPRRATGWAVDHMMEGRFAEASGDLRWAIDEGVFDDTDAAPWFYLGTALALQDQFDEALDAARRASEIDPDSAEFAARPAWILYLAERTDEAVAAYTGLIERFDGASDAPTREVLKEARMTLSYIALDQGDAEGSAEWLEQVLDEFPDDAGAMNDLGYLWADRGTHLLRARRMIGQAVEAAPGNAAYLDSLGWAHYRLGDLQAALEAIEKAVSIETSSGDEADAEILDHLGDVLHALGRRQEAVDAWRRALKQYEESEDERAAKVREKIGAQDKPPGGAAKAARSLWLFSRRGAGGGPQARRATCRTDLPRVAGQAIIKVC